MARLFLALSIVVTASCASARPKVIAHRGASGYLPEHSLPAVTAAHIMNVDYIEQDVVLSKDGVPVVLHDIHLETVTDVETVYPQKKRRDGRFYAIDFTLQQLKKLTLHERAKANGTPVFVQRYPLSPTPFRIPTLEEEIQLIQGLNKSRKKNIGIYVELKAPEFHKQNNLPMEDAVLAVLSKFNYRNKDSNIFLQCFDPRTLKSLKKKTSIRLVQLIGLNEWKESDADYDSMMTLNGLDEIASYADGVGPYVGSFINNGQLVHQDWVEKAKQLGLEVHPYTFRADQVPESFNSFKSFLTAFSVELGVTGLFTDHPDQVIHLLNE